MENMEYSNALYQINEILKYMIPNLKARIPKKVISYFENNKSQEYIKKTIDSLVKDHTVMIVAHRLSTIVDADIIHVVKKGKVVDSGTHDELLEKSEIYRSLYKTETLNSN